MVTYIQIIRWKAITNVFKIVHKEIINSLIHNQRLVYNNVKETNLLSKTTNIFVRHAKTTIMLYKWDNNVLIVKMNQNMLINKNVNQKLAY